MRGRHSALRQMRGRLFALRHVRSALSFDEHALKLLRLAASTSERLLEAPDGTIALTQPAQERRARASVASGACARGAASELECERRLQTVR